MEDVQLVHALQTRQDGAMEQFQTAYTPLLRYIIAPILPDARDREECLSDVLLRVWDSIGTFDPGRALWAAVERLGRRDRELFLRKYYYYQPIAQIAAESGLTVRAVEGKLYRIRKHLQSELGGVIHG